jgi:hypothetical protein
MKPHEDSFFCVSEATSLKNETEVFEDSFFISEATSLKNETEVYEHSSCFYVKLVKK